MKRLLFALLTLVIISCNQGVKEKEVPKESSEKETITLGSFNIEWLGDGIEDRKERTEDEYKRIAEAIIESGADILGIQEIENKAALDKIMKYMPDYSYYLGENGWLLNTGVIFKKDVKISNPQEYLPLKVVEDKTRPGFIVDAKKGNFDFKLMVVHFKSTSRYDDSAEKRQGSFDMRKMQSQVVNNWIDSVLALGGEQDLFVVGDFNDNPGRGDRSNVTVLHENQNFTFLTIDLPSCRDFPDSIDHIALSESAKNRYLQKSMRNYSLYTIYDEETADMISDHCPVLAEFDITMPDND